MKLYWRYKKNGNWTWKPAIEVNRDCCEYLSVMPANWIIPESEEEE